MNATLMQNNNISLAEIHVEEAHLRNGSNITNCPQDRNIVIMKIALGYLLTAVALVGNGIVLIAVGHVYFRRGTLARFTLFIHYLAVADVLVAIFNILPQAIDDTYTGFPIDSHSLCKAYRFLQMVPVYASCFILVLLSLDRYICVMFPLHRKKYPGNWSVHVMVAVAFLLGAVLASPQVIYFRMMPMKSMPFKHCGTTMSRTVTDIYVQCVFVSVFLLPLKLMLYFYAHICFIVYRGFQTIHNQDGGAQRRSDYHEAHKLCGEARKLDSIVMSPSGNAETTSRHKDSVRFSSVVMPPGEDLAAAPTGVTSKEPRPVVKPQTPRIPRNRQLSLKKKMQANAKTLAVSLSVCAAYTACWAPFFISQIWWVYYPPETKGCGFGWFVNLCLYLGNLNSCCNPWIYGVFAFISMRSAAKLRARRMKADQLAALTSTAADRRRSSCAVGNTTRDHLTSGNGGDTSRPSNAFLRHFISFNNTTSTSLR